MPLDATWTEIGGTPLAVEYALESLASSIKDLAAALTLRRIARVAVVGSGDSLVVGLMAAAAFAEFAGRPLEAVQAYEYAAYGHPDFGPDRAVLVVSSSGRPSPTRDALARALAGEAFVIGISDRAGEDNPFLTRPPFALCPGAAKRGIPTQSTSATLAVLLRLAVEWGLLLTDGFRCAAAASELRRIPKRLSVILGAHAETTEALGWALPSWRRIHIVGAGPNVGTAQTAALLFGAGPGLAALPHEVEEFHHGLKLASLTRDDLVLVLAPSGSCAEDRLSQTIAAARARSAEVVVLGASRSGGTVEIPLPRTIEAFSPLLMLPILQQIALHAGLAVAQDAMQPFRARALPATHSMCW